MRMALSASSGWMTGEKEVCPASYLVSSLVYEFSFRFEVDDYSGRQCNKIAARVVVLNKSLILDPFKQSFSRFCAHIYIYSDAINKRKSSTWLICHFQRRQSRVPLPYFVPLFFFLFFFSFPALDRIQSFFVITQIEPNGRTHFQNSIRPGRLKDLTLCSVFVCCVL